jgi:hypothetical protein
MATACSNVTKSQAVRLDTWITLPRQVCDAGSCQKRTRNDSNWGGVYSLGTGNGIRIAEGASQSADTPNKKPVQDMSRTGFRLFSPTL